MCFFTPPRPVEKLQSDVCVILSDLNWKHTSLFFCLLYILDVRLVVMTNVILAVE